MSMENRCSSCVNWRSVYMRRNIRYVYMIHIFTKHRSCSNQRVQEENKAAYRDVLYFVIFFPSSLFLGATNSPYWDICDSCHLGHRRAQCLATVSSFWPRSTDQGLLSPSPQSLPAQVGSVRVIPADLEGTNTRTNKLKLLICFWMKRWENSCC